MKFIHLWGVNQNNLKNIEVKIPLGQLTVICGPSGSGKSSLAFETLFAEGQRRFIESMSNYTKQFLAKAPKPDIEGVSQIPPAIALEQKNSVKSSRSIVGTTTEILDYLRVIYEKMAIATCPDHHHPVRKLAPTEATELALTHLNGQRGYVLVPVDKSKRFFQSKDLAQAVAEDSILRIYVPNSKKPVETSADSILMKVEMGEIIDVTPALLKKGLPKGTFFLVLDRISFNQDSRARLNDSIEQAYSRYQKYNQSALSRRAFLLTTEGHLLKLTDSIECPVCDFAPPPLRASLFSFNSPLGACPTCKGFGNVMSLDVKKIVPNDEFSISQGALQPIEMPSASADKRELLKYCRKAKINLTTPWKDLPSEQQKALLEGDEDFYGIKGVFDYLETKKYKMHVRVYLSRFKSPFVCSTCNGTRLRPELASIFFKGKTIHQLTQMTVEDLADFFKKVDLSQSEQEIVEEPLRQISNRLKFLCDVGVGYLTINRETRTLSGGEYQRLMLANQLGVGLSQSLYVLDEPTVGLHPRDNDRLIKILIGLKDLGNTVVIVEHDHDVIRASEHIIEMGPGSGFRGGEVIFSGPTDSFYSSEQSVTAPYLKENKKWVPTLERRPTDLESYKYILEMDGCSGNNLKNLHVKIPLHRLVVVTGVSGSGKSTLVTGTLFPAIAKKLKLDFDDQPMPFKGLYGVDHIKNAVLVDQSPIGRSSRSNPVTYLKVYDHIRDLMADTLDAKARAMTAGTFSLNVDGGRCPDCKGVGFLEIDMMFMDNIIMTCETCQGKKFKNEVLSVKYQRKNIFEILSLTVDEALDFFVASPVIRKPLMLLKEVGLDYIQLGQSASTLSGGESQRLKIAKELSIVKQRNTLYVLDEPTTGLHFREVDMLLKVLHKLVESGASVIVVEHNLDVINSADYILDIGPEAGKRGGKILFAGTPESLMNDKKSSTAQYLREYNGL